MSIASEVNAYRPIGVSYRPIGVLLGGPFAPQRSIEPKRVMCALLRAPTRLVEADNQMHSIGFASVLTRRVGGHHG